MDAVLTAMVDDRIGPGKCSSVLLQTAKEQIGFDFAIAPRSPAAALSVALSALGLVDGDIVLLSALSPRYYLRVLTELRLKPVYCDVSSLSFPCMGRENIEKTLAMTQTGVSSPKALLLHHTLGFVPDTADIAALGIPVIEDVSASFRPPVSVRDEGTPDKGDSGDTEAERAGPETRERAHGVFSLLGLEERDLLTSGGGAILFAMARRDASVLRDHSDLPPEYCLPDINASLAGVQFKEAERNLARRGEIAGIYTRASLRTRHGRFLALNGLPYNDYAFPLVLESSVKDVMDYARKKDIAVERAFDYTLVAAGAVDSGTCPTSHSLALRTVLFPLYPRLRSAETERVSKLIMTLP